MQLSKIRSFKRGCASASPAAPFLCSTARIRQDIIAQSYFVVLNCADALVNMFYVTEADLLRRLTLGFNEFNFDTSEQNK